MTEEQKQALANDLTAYIGQPLNNPMTRSQWMEIAKIALAALTARPIELPQRYSCEGYHIDEAYLVEDEEGDCFDRDEVIGKLRQQGYEVQE